MRALSGLVASLIVLGMTPLKCACLCSTLAFAQVAPSGAPPAHDHCKAQSAHPGDEHRTPENPSRSCPHCDHVRAPASTVVASAGLLVPGLSVTSVLPLQTAVPENLPATLRHGRAVIHSPPPLALLRQKCVLLI